MSVKMHTFAGFHIREAVTQALALAIRHQDTVEFEFNGSVYTVEPTDTDETATARAYAQISGVK